MTTLSFDHVHVISKQPKDTADWYAERLGGTITKSATVKDAPQIYVSFGEAFIIVRGQRPGESAKDKANTEWGADHFGFRRQQRRDSIRFHARDIIMPFHRKNDAAFDS